MPESDNEESNMPESVGHLAVPDFDTNVLHTNEYLTIGSTDTLVKPI